MAHFPLVHLKYARAAAAAKRTQKKQTNKKKIKMHCDWPRLLFQSVQLHLRSNGRLCRSGIGAMGMCSAACVVIDAALKALAFVECIVIFDCRWTVNDQRIWRRSRGGCMRALIDANCYSTVRRCPNNCGINWMASKSMAANCNSRAQQSQMFNHKFD